MTEYTAKRARTRAQLLAAGQELLPGAVRRGLEHALGPGPVTKRATVSRQTWYRYWRADNSAYLDELLAAALDTVAFLIDRRLSDIVARVGSDPDGVAVLARAHFALWTQRRIAIPNLLGVMLAFEDHVLEQEDGVRPTAAPEIARRHQERVRASISRAYRDLIGRAGRIPTVGNDLGAVTDVFVALGDGFALRQLTHPRPGAEDAFAATALAMLDHLTTPSAGHAATGA